MAESEAKPKVLLVTRNYPPLRGGMERLNWQLSKVLGQSARVMVVGPAGAAAHAPEQVAVFDVPLQPLSRFLLSAALRTIRLARIERPAFVLAGSGLTVPIVWIAANSARARSIAYVHGLDVVARHPVYRLCWLPFLRRMNRVITNSRATAALCEAAGVRIERITVVHPGTQLQPETTEEDRSLARIQFRERHALGDGPLLLSVGRLTARKGVSEFINEVLPAIVAVHPRCTLVVVGDVPTHALQAAASSTAQIHRVAQTMGLEQNVRCLGTLSDLELRFAYRAADVHVLPVRNFPHDPEGFGMVSIEAAAHGLPTVAYACGGVPDAVCDGVSGVLIQSGDAAAFAKAVVELLRNPLPTEPMRKFAEGFSWENFGRKMAEVLR